MATLTGQTIAASYGKLLVTDSNSGLSGTATNIEDGDGTGSKLYLSTTTLGIGYNSFTPVADTLLNIETDQEENATCKTLMITNTHAGANAGPLLELYRNSGSPAAADVMGKISFTGEDAGGAKHTYASIASSIADPTASGEDGSLTIQCATAGTDATTIATFNYVGADGVIPVDMPGVGGLVVAQHIWQSAAKQVLTRDTNDGWEFIHDEIYLDWIQPTNGKIIIEASLYFGGLDEDYTEFLGLGLVGGLYGATDSGSTNNWEVATGHTHGDDVLATSDFFNEGSSGTLQNYNRAGSHIRVTQTDNANDQMTTVQFYFQGLTPGERYIVRLVACDLERDQGWSVCTGGQAAPTLEPNHSGNDSNFPPVIMKAITVPNTVTYNVNT